jgi:hypothetical protein
MQINRLTILFVISKNRKRRDNTVPIFCRITYLKKRKEFSTGLYINPSSWDNKNQAVKPSEKKYEFLNSKLSLIKDYQPLKHVNQ